MRTSEVIIAITIALAIALIVGIIISTLDVSLLAVIKNIFNITNFKITKIFWRF